MTEIIPTTATVHDAYPHHCDVGFTNIGEYLVVRAGLSPALKPDKATLVVAGDIVDIKPISAVDVEEMPRHHLEGLEWVVTRVHPRRSKISRPGHGRHGGEWFEQVIAANLDLLAIVVSVKKPPFHPRLVDRYLVAAERGEVEPVICLNKIDLLEPEDPPEELQELQQFDNEILRVSGKTGENIDKLASRIRGLCVAFVGHSGVGKSSIINALFPGLNLKTSGLRRGDRRGRHTTSRASLFRVDDEGTRLIDTPGIKSLDIWGITAEELHWYFPDFEDYWRECHFNDCTHTHETDCAVKRAVAEGKIKQVRYDSYVRLYQSLKLRK